MLISVEMSLVIVKTKKWRTFAKRVVINVVSLFENEDLGLCLG